MPVGREAVEARRGLPAPRPARARRRRAEPRLFVNFRGGALTRQGLYKIVGRHAPAAGLDGQDEPAYAAPHLRHAPARGRLRPALGAGDARATPTSRRPSSTRTCRKHLKDAYFKAHPAFAALDEARHRLGSRERARAPRGRDDPPPARAACGGSHDRGGRGLRPALVRAREPARTWSATCAASASPRSGGAASTCSLELEDERFLVMHLRMTGNLLWVVARTTTPPAGRTCACASCSTTATACCSSTCAGSARASWSTGRDELDRYLDERVGPEPLEPRLHAGGAAAARRAAAGRR